MWSWCLGLVFWGVEVSWGRRGRRRDWDWGNVYERKVDLPQEGSPRRRMVTVGAESMDSCTLMPLQASSLRF